MKYIRHLLHVDCPYCKSNQHVVFVCHVWNVLIVILNVMLFPFVLLLAIITNISFKTLIGMIRTCRHCGTVFRGIQCQIIKPIQQCPQCQCDTDLEHQDECVICGHCGWSHLALDH